MFGVALKLFGIAFAVVCVIFTAAGAFRNARRLDAGIDAFKREQEELRKSGRALNPYEELSKLYADQGPPTPRPQRPNGTVHRSWQARLGRWIGRRVNKL